MVRLPGCECVLVVVQCMQPFTARAMRESTFAKRKIVRFSKSVWQSLAGVRFFGAEFLNVAGHLDWW